MNRSTPSPVELHTLLGGIDIYLFDQLMKGRLQPGMRVLDAGCGRGRNVRYLLQAGFDVWAIDQVPEAVEAVREFAARVVPSLPSEQFRVEDLSALSFADTSFDVVISNAVLHFVANRDEFDTMIAELWRVLRPHGMLFVRLASTIGATFPVEPLGRGCYRLPDASVRYLVDEKQLIDTTRRLGGELLEPLKTTVVQRQRCMTTWCLQKAHV
ncbi:MAG: class I SAM-dependent methyltransferase [Candidatus Latescibacterota bacterium]|nr:MAG: class I SAM-dependent methyltransferase [Candidatus Latescibacterota bacterium]